MSCVLLEPAPYVAVETAAPSVKRGTSLPWLRTVRRCALGLVLLSIAWRLCRWLLQFPIWGDEAYLCVNFLDRDYLDLTRPLRWVQVAPLLFLWGELSAYRLLGGSELALRLLPFLAGLGTLVLFWRLARMTLAPVPRYLAVGIFAVSYYPVRHSCEIKPYATDLLVTLALLLLALTWQRRPERLRWLGLLALAAPVALAASYPAVFIAAAISLVLLPTAWRQGSRARALFAAYNVLLAVGFLGPYLLAGVGQFESTGGTHNEYWAEWFPPAAPAALTLWLLKAHTGNMLAYPVGGPRFASSLTFLLCLAGAWRLGRSARWDLLALCGLPFALTFLAAALHRYPYGGSARIAQHLAPAICLLAGVGAFELLQRLPRVQVRRCVLLVFAALALVAGGGLVHDLLKPYKTPADQEVRRIVTDVFAQARAEDQIVVLSPPGDLWPTFEWYLRQQEARVAFDGRLDPERLARGGEVWALAFGGDAVLPASLVARLHQGPRPLSVHNREHYTLQLGQIDATVVRCQVLHLAAE